MNILNDERKNVTINIREDSQGFNVPLNDVNDGGLNSGSDDDIDSVQEEESLFEPYGRLMARNNILTLGDMLYMKGLRDIKHQNNERKESLLRKREETLAKLRVNLDFFIRTLFY